MKANRVQVGDVYTDVDGVERTVVSVRRGEVRVKFDGQAFDSGMPPEYVRFFRDNPGATIRDWNRNFNILAEKLYAKRESR